MERKLYISDTHFGHKNILHYDNRPFFTTQEMEDGMVERWNAAVRPEDTVYILGDFCWGNTGEWQRILKRLDGRKALIRGNHDPFGIENALADEFVESGDYREIEDAGRHVVLCHYPIPCFKNQFRGWYHLYGHVHVSFEAHMMEHDRRMIRDLYKKECQMYNVGCMMPWMNYTPRTLDEILEWEAQHGKV